MCLETVTRQYGVMILVSEALVRTCTQHLAYYFRVLDYVRLPGAKAPARIFTVDLDCTALAVDPSTSAESRKRQQMQQHRKSQRGRRSDRYQERQRREELKLEKLEP